MIKRDYFREYVIDQVEDGRSVTRWDYFLRPFVRGTYGVIYICPYPTAEAPTYPHFAARIVRNDTPHIVGAIEEMNTLFYAGVTESYWENNWQFTLTIGSMFCLTYRGRLIDDYVALKKKLFPNWKIKMIKF